MLEHPEIIRGNIKRYQDLLTVNSPHYTHENVRELLVAAKVQLRHASIEVSKVNG